MAAFYVSSSNDFLLTSLRKPREPRFSLNGYRQCHRRTSFSFPLSRRGSLSCVIVYLELTSPVPNERDLVSFRFETNVGLAFYPFYTFVEGYVNPHLLFSDNISSNTFCFYDFSSSFVIVNTMVYLELTFPISTQRHFASFYVISFRNERRFGFLFVLQVCVIERFANRGLLFSPILFLSKRSVSTTFLSLSF